jgi:hypothetical protein
MAWPTIEDLEKFTRQTADDVMQWALDASIQYGTTVLDVDADGVPYPPDASVFNACLDYAGTLYTQRIGGNDVFVTGVEGSTPQQRYRRILLASRPVGFA